MGVMQFFQNLGNDFIGLFLKIMLVLVVLVIIVLAIVAIAQNWLLVLGMLIGLLFSASLYKWLNTRFKLDLPEFFFWGLSEIMEALTIDEGRANEIKQELYEKRKLAEQQIAKMEQKVAGAQATYSDLKAKQSIPEIMKPATKHVSSRTRKALMMHIDEKPWLDELNKPNEEVDWSKFN